MNKKYLPSALILYLNYFIHGVGCSILGQAVIKEALAAAWGVEAMAITAISAALGLGRLIALPFAGPLSDKFGRRISTAIGSASYAIYLIGLALAFNAGTHGGYTIAYVCAIIGGIANSFLDTGIYLGGWDNCSLFMTSLVLAFVYAIIQILVRKKSAKSEIPFVPFVLSAYVLYLGGQII